MKQLVAHILVLSTMVASVSTVNAQFVQEKRIDATESAVNSQVMRILVQNAETNESVETDVVIRGLNPRKPVTMKAVADTTFAIRNYRLYTVSCVELGYMYYSEKFWPEEKELHIQKVKLQTLAVGLDTDIRDIEFLGDKTEIYHKSKPALDELIGFLNVNPTVSIAVIGHVNGPDNAKSQKFYNKVSVQRAEAIVAYLTEHGIAEDRLSAEGAGNSDMMYPDPQTEWQNEANRRIQIRITSI